MWILCAVLSAVTAGLSVVLQKKGTAGSVYQTSAVNSLAMLAAVVCLTAAKGSFSELTSVPVSSWILTITSGIVQAASWVFYFLALKDASVSFLMVLDKANIIVTLFLAWLILDESVTAHMLLGVAMILAGTVLMGEWKKDSGGGNKRWILWGILSPSLQAITNILAKLDTAAVDSALMTTIRLLIVTVVLCGISWWKEGALLGVSVITGKSGLFCLVAGGLVLGLSYVLMYQGIADGSAAIVTVIVRSGFLVSTLLAVAWLKERLSARGWLGFTIVFAGVMLFLL